MTLRLHMFNSEHLYFVLKSYKGYKYYLFEMEKVVAEERLWLKTFHKEKLLLFCFFFLPDFGRLSVTMVMAILQQFVDRKSGKKQNKWKAVKLVRSNKTKYRDLCDLRT